MNFAALVLTRSASLLGPKAGTYKYHGSPYAKTMAGSILVKAVTP
jgi:hypothetical protein